MIFKMEQFLTKLQQVPLLSVLINLRSTTSSVRSMSCTYRAVGTHNRKPTKPEKKKIPTRRAKYKKIPSLAKIFVVCTPF